MASERVFRSPSVGWRTESRITPATCPSRRVEWVKLLGVPRFFVTDQGPIRCRARVGAGLPPSLPKHFIAAQERQVHARRARRFHIRALATRPILVMPNRQKNLMFEQLRTVAVRVHARDIANIVTVGLQPADGANFCPENKILGAGYGPNLVTSRKRPIVANLIGTTVAGWRV